VNWEVLTHLIFPSFNAHLSLISSDVEMDGSSYSEAEIEPGLAITPDVLTARKPIPSHSFRKGKHYD
jgi:hypothetical protein